ncbi:hypothetical protein FRX31_022635 [Thalictrum thalictroides]|uniref:DUF4283 domain-containing protein n=1 Tax=Thalictrum thalictroides TaxID=46969 RepID=A0A7J6VT79_THATH|nr:hypothetical protein FRX31_022635 [Thalictrum thalictroides]
MALPPDPSMASKAVDGSTPAPQQSFAAILKSPTSSQVVLPPASFRSFKKDGKPAFSFSKEDLERGQLLVSAHSVVLRFSAERPSLGIIRAGIQKNWNVNGNFNLGLLDARHVLVTFDAEAEVTKSLSRYNCQFLGIRFKIFRWYPGYNLKKDPVRAPVWVDLPNLPLEFFNPAFLEVLGNGLGSFVAVDRDTRAFTKPDVARMCVEMNVDGDMHEAVWIEGHNYTGFWQPLFYPNFLYCSHCSKLGHSFENCRKRKTNIVDKGKGKEGDSTAFANPTTTATKNTNQTGPVYKATGNIFTNIPSGNLEKAMEVDNSTKDPTQGTKNTGNTQPHTALLLTNAFDILNEDHTDNISVIQPVTKETIQGQNPETAVSPHSERSNAPSNPSTSISPQQQTPNNICVDPTTQKDDANKSPSKQNSPQIQHTHLEKGATGAQHDTNQVTANTPAKDSRGTTTSLNPSSSTSLPPSESHKSKKPPPNLSPSHLTPLPIHFPLSGGGMKRPDSSFMIPDYHNPTYNEDFPPLVNDFDEGDFQEDNPLTPSYGSDPGSYSKNTHRSGSAAKKLSSRAQALDRVP